MRGVAAAVALGVVSAAMAAGPAFQSAEEALRQGIGAYNGGLHELAVPALEFAAEKDEFLARYYLARIYSDNTGSHTDHGKAYRIYQEIADEHADGDPDDDRRAVYVGKSLTALAGYLRTGLPAIGLKPDLTRAAAYLRHAALFFRDEDAQFELAKMQLADDGEARDADTAKHWLSVLSRKGHAGAQAFLADLYWRGEQMERDPVRALVLVTVAVGNAPVNERVWIEDIHQSIFCGSSPAMRKEAAGMIAGWRDRYGRKPSVEDRPGPVVLDLRPRRTCGDDEPVTPIEGESASAQFPVKSAGAAEPRPFLKGSSGDVVHDVGTRLAPEEAR